jgi:SAM-dependent methyltransferase
MNSSELQSDWEKSIAHEIAFWTKWVTEPSYLSGRIEPDRWIQEEIRALINIPENKNIRVLEVGSGPMTIIANVWGGYNLEVVAVDPLADEYNAILDANGIVPPIRTLKCAGEDLTKLFDENSFDFAQAHNCLDHSWSPIQCIEQMLIVVKPEATIDLMHYINESDNQSGVGLHAWNFFEENGNFMIEGKGDRINVNDTFNNIAKIEVSIINTQINVRLKKLPL